MDGLRCEKRTSKVLRAQHTKAFSLHEIVHPPGLQMTWHSHEAAAIVLTLDGSSRQTFSNAQFNRTKSSVLIRPAGVPHCDSTGQNGGRFFRIELRPLWIQATPQLHVVLLR